MKVSLFSIAVVALLVSTVVVATLRYLGPATPARATRVPARAVVVDARTLLLSFEDRWSPIYAARP